MVSGAKVFMCFKDQKFEFFSKSSTYAGIVINLGQKSKIGLMPVSVQGESFAKSYSLLSSVPYHGSRKYMRNFSCFWVHRFLCVLKDRKFDFFFKIVNLRRYSYKPGPKIKNRPHGRYCSG